MLQHVLSTMLTILINYTTSILLIICIKNYIFSDNGNNTHLNIIVQN